MRTTVLRLSLTAAAVLAPAAAAPAHGQDVAPSPFLARSCPLPAGAQGYPVWVRAADGTVLDSMWTRAVANAAARRWEPPSRARGQSQGLNRIRSRVQTPEPRWPDDWSPEARHTAQLEVTLTRAGRPGEARVTAPSGDRQFDRSLPGIFRDPAPGSPELPALPAGVESVKLLVGFGSEPEAGAGFVRFAAQQTPVRVVPGTLQVGRPRTSGVTMVISTTVKYDVDATGRFLPNSFQVLHTTDGMMNELVRNGLLGARFEPAQSNCRPVELSVVQTFGPR